MLRIRDYRCCVNRRETSVEHSRSLRFKSFESEGVFERMEGPSLYTIVIRHITLPDLLLLVQIQSFVICEQSPGAEDRIPSIMGDITGLSGQAVATCQTL